MAVILGGLLVLAVALIAVVAIRMNQAPEVRRDFQPPPAPPASTAGVPDGNLAFNSDRTGNFELFIMNPDGSGVRQLTSDPRWDSWWPRISPDRRTILFHRSPKGVHDRDYAQVSLWAIAADGSGLAELRPVGLDGWVQQGHAEWSPDGTQLVMFGGNRTSPQIFLTDPRGQQPRPVTNNRPGTNLDPAFSPDGRTIVFVGCPGAICTGGGQEIFRIGTNGGEAVRLTNDDLRDQDPYYSPDGGQLAWLTQVEGGLIGVWDVRIGDAEARNPRRLVGDEGITSRPQFSADGRTIYVHRLAPGAKTWGVYAVNPDGSGLRNLTEGQPGNNEYPST